MTEAELIADLLSRNYVPIEASPRAEVREALAKRGLVQGARVCHEGQKWYEARDAGTAVVVAVYHKPRSAWEHSYGRPDVEVLIERATERFGTSVALWSDYQTHVAYAQRAQLVEA